MPDLTGQPDTVGQLHLYPTPTLLMRYSCGTIPFTQLADPAECMVKVSITLPNAAQITLESEEAEVIHEVIKLALRDLPNDLMQGNSNASTGLGQSQALGKSTSVALETATSTPGASPNASPEISPSASPDASPNASSEGPTATAKAAPNSSQLTDGNHRGLAPAPAGAPPMPRTIESELAFAEFCRAASPMGDMRRVVVAAEGAHRYLGMNSVNSTELVTLFNIVGWPLPHNFTQTLRNAARDKFHWLERVPGRAGRYYPTDLGRSVTLGQ